MSNDKLLCRACLVSEESFNYFLFDNVRPEIYSFCTSVEVKLEEDLSRALCDLCYQLLLKFFEFKQTCIQSQKALLSYSYISSEISNVCVYADRKQKTNFKRTVKTDSSVHSDDNNDTKYEINENHELINDDSSKLQSTYKDTVETVNSYGNNLISGSKISKIKPVKREYRFIGSPELQHKATNNLTTKKHKRLKKGVKNGMQKQTETFKKNSSAKNHKLSHHNNEPSIQCTTCSKTYMTLCGLRRHVQSCHTKVDLKQLECGICGKISKSKDTLRMHIKSHGERKFFVCDICGKSCTTAYSLKGHAETHKANREREFTCEHCGKKFFTNSILISHISRRHKGRRFICDICNFTFTDKSNLSKHLLIHEGKKLFKCNVCHKSYRAKNTLVEHQRIHTGEKPFACRYCSKRFLCGRRLTDHHRIHTGEKPFKCVVCGLAFTQRGTLNRHTRVHERRGEVTILGVET